MTKEKRPKRQTVVDKIPKRKL